MRWTTVFGILVGGLLVAIGGILALSPEILPSDVWQQVLLYSSWIEAIPVPYVVGGLIAFAALLYLRTQTAGSQNTHQVYRTDPTKVYQPSPELGDEFDQAIEMEHPYTYLPEQSETHQSARVPQEMSLNLYRSSVDPADTLQETLENVLHQTHRTDNIAEVIKQGEWTSNQIAAATMSTHQDFPLSHRVLRWLQPDIARQREFEVTTSEIYRVASANAPDYASDDQ